MKCPICHSESKVLDSRPIKNSTYRRRECLECFTRFTSFEQLETKSLDPFLQSRASPIVYEPSGKGKWTKRETENLAAMYKERIPHKEIAKALNRSYMSVSQRLYLLRKKGELIKTYDQ
jgi:transcriptional regulator NrdR family protein